MLPDSSAQPAAQPADTPITRNAVENVLSAALSTTQKYLLCIGIGVLVEIGAIFALLAMFLSSGSSSKDFILTCVFPYSWLGNVHIAVPLKSILGFASLLQWPIYGLILARGWVRQRFLIYAAILATTHMVAVEVSCKLMHIVR